MNEHGIPAGRVYTPADMLADPHFKAREALIDVPHERWSNLTMQNVFPKLSKTPGSVRSVAPARVGQDNHLLRELLSEDDFTRLTKEKVI